MLRFVDSFDHYDSNRLQHKWSEEDPLTAGASIFIHSSEGRFGGGCLNINDRFGGVFITLPVSQSTWIVGFAYKSDDVEQFSSVIDGQRMLCAWYDGGVPQCALMLNGDMTLSVAQGDETILGTSKAVPLDSAYAYIEWKVTINSSGSFEVRVNDETVLTGTGDTTQSANNSANRLMIGQERNSGVTNSDNLYDDLYICDTTGSINNDFLGDTHVERLVPTGDAGQNDWVLFDTGGGATFNYQVVDELIAPDDDSTYVAGSVAGQRELYTFANPTIQGGTYNAIQVSLYAKKNSAGSRTLQHVIVAAGTQLGNSIYFEGSYVYWTQLYETDPNTASWNQATLNAMQLGMDVES